MTNKRLFLFTLLATLFISGCGDNATVTKNTDKKHLECLQLTLLMPDALISNTLKSLYNFSENCPYQLQVSRKNNIVCNSNQNADRKALSNFPSGYIRMDVYKNHKPIYSYYKDLTCKVSQDDIESAFKRLKSDLLEE